MLKRMLWLLLFAGAVFAQDDEEDDGIEIDSVPDAEEPEDSSKPAKKPTLKRGKRPGTVLFTARMYEIELPEAWEPKLIDAPKFELAWDIKIPGSKLSARLHLNRQDRMADPRSAPRGFRDGAMKNFKGKEAKLLFLPLPQLIVHYGKGEQAAVALYVFRKIRGNPYYLLFQCGKAVFAEAQAEIVAAMKSLKSTAKRYPSIPKDYGKLAFYYACMFHAGKYKKQYKKFLKEYGETLDWKTAFANHLEPIGYDALKAATETFMYTKIKAIQPKN